jgi:DNA polymerase-3 subunit gamma/tau
LEIKNWKLKNIMSLSLYRKYRPLTFSDVIGQGHIVQTLSNAITHNRIGHAYLFTGPRGTGKTTMARIFARAVNCQNPKGADPCLECESCKNITEGRSLDIFEIDAASNTGVDNIRELRENVKFPPTTSKFKVYIIDEVHMLSTGAFNALLKTLEEPPAHVIFILATTEIHKVPETIISRCQRYDFTRLSLEHIIEKLSTIAKNEKVSIEKNALEMIAIAAEGGMRDAESLLAQVMSLEDKKITAKEVEEILGTTQRQSLEAMVSYLLNKDASSAITLVNELSRDGYDLDVFNKSFLNYLRQVMLVCVDAKLAKIFSYELTKDQASALVEQAKSHSAKELLFIIQSFSEIQGKIKSSFIPQLPLEMAIIKAVSGSQALPAQTAPQTPNSQQISAPQPARPIQAPTPRQEPKTAPVSPVTPVSAPTAPLESKPEKEAVLPISSEPTLVKNEAQIADSNFTLNDVKKNWHQFIIDTKVINHSLSAVLQSCQPVDVTAGIITVATKFTFHKDKLNEYGNKLTLEGVFAKILGLRLLIKVITAEEAGITIASSLTPHNSGGSAEQATHETSSLLNDAMNLMGGSIVE